MGSIGYLGIDTKPSNYRESIDDINTFFLKMLDYTISSEIILEYNCLLIKCIINKGQRLSAKKE